MSEVNFDEYMRLLQEVEERIASRIAALNTLLESPSMPGSRATRPEYPGQLTAVDSGLVFKIFIDAEAYSDALRQNRFEMARRNEFPKNNKETLREERWWRIATLLHEEVYSTSMKRGAAIIVSQGVTLPLTTVEEIIAAYKEEQEQPNPNVCFQCHEKQAMSPGSLCVHCQQKQFDESAPDGCVIAKVVPNDELTLFRKIGELTGISITHDAVPIDLVHNGAEMSFTHAKLFVRQEDAAGFNLFMKTLEGYARKASEKWPNVSDDTITKATQEWKHLNAD